MVRIGRPGNSRQGRKKGVAEATMTKDYYQVLGVSQDAGQEQIRAAYRKLALQYHPDRNREDPEALDKMKTINEAYAVLSDQEKRKEYDTYRHDFGSFASQRYRERYSEEDIFRGSDINQIFEEMSRAFGFRNFDELFKEFYGSRYKTFTFRKPGAFGRVFIFQGSRPPGDQDPEQGRRFQEQKQGPSLPQGPFSGMLGKFLMRRLGKAFGVTVPERGRDLYDSLALTPEQAKTGGKIAYSLKKWGRPGKIMVHVPQKVKEGQNIRLKGLGADGKEGGEAGDLYLEVKIKVSLTQRIKRLFK